MVYSLERGWFNSSLNLKLIAIKCTKHDHLEGGQGKRFLSFANQDEFILFFTIFYSH